MTTETEDKGADKTGNTMDKSYLGQLILTKNKEGIRKYVKYTKDHAARLRRLEREANGEDVPGDYDGGY